MEKKVIEKFYHEHPLILTGTVSETDSSNCYGCGKPVTNLDAAYICMDQHCSNKIILHRSCGELPSEIMHPKHSHHPLHLFDYHRKRGGWCDLCFHNLGKVLGYQCSSCNLDFCITCEIISIDALLDEKRELRHPCHLDHPLTLMRKTSLEFYCDGCGTRDVDLPYICSICEFWIHKSCASLPLILPKNLQYHHHDLSLAFSFPMEYLEYIFDCDICHKKLNRTCWLYFCGECRFFAHLKCAASTTESTKQDSNINKNENESCDVIQFPLYAHDISKELITPFVMREKGLTKIPHITDYPPTVNIPETTSSFSFLFNYHNHPLSLISDFQEDHKKIMNDEEIENDELKVCDVCVTPISSPPYYECAPCKYFVHSICYLLPKTLSSPHPLHGRCPETHDTNHKFTLYTSSKSMDMDVNLCRCELCGFRTNGMVYKCEGCEMKIDVKCMSLPTTIKHASHLHHATLILARIPKEEGDRINICQSCGDPFDGIGYRCSNSDCDFALNLDCALLPSSITNHVWDKHVLSLTFDASLDHPSNFFCEFCEGGEMNPKKCMYHCRQCDCSFHLWCLKNASGAYRNIKFGREFVLDGFHHHPLTFNWVTLKRRCDICHRNVYNYRGLECVACYYVVCLYCLFKHVS